MVNLDCSFFRFCHPSPTQAVQCNKVSKIKCLSLCKNKVSNNGVKSSSRKAVQNVCPPIAFIEPPWQATKQKKMRGM
jgi:hypothetical protein